MATTNFKYKKILIGIFLSISLLFGFKTNAQITFHLTGSYVFSKNIGLENTDPVQKIKNSMAVYQSWTKDQLKAGSIKKGLEIQKNKKSITHFQTEILYASIKKQQLKTIGKTNNKD